MSSIHLVLTYHWFEEIDSGRKTREFRDNTAYWRKRIIDKNPDIVIFHKGYTNTVIHFKVENIEINYGNERIVIHLGDRLNICPHCGVERSTKGWLDMCIYNCEKKQNLDVPLEKKGERK